jgi:hypothetical protein
MARLVQSQKRFAVDGVSPRAAAGPEKLEDYLERVAKYVPVEIVLAYVTIQSLFQATSGDAAPKAVEIVFYAALVLATAPYLMRFGGPVPNKKRQALIGTISFVVWTYGIGGQFFWKAFEEIVGARLIYPSIAGGVVVLWSLAVGFIKPEQA